MKGQSSIEASLIISFMLLVFVAFVGILGKQLVDVSKDNEIQALEKIGDKLFTEVHSATKFEDGYRRNITLPSKVKGKNYTITFLTSVNHSEMVLTTVGRNNITDVVFLPTNVTGELKVGNQYINTITSNKGQVELTWQIR